MECTKELVADEERIHFPVVLSHFQHAWNRKQAASVDYVSIGRVSPLDRTPYTHSHNEIFDVGPNSNVILKDGLKYCYGADEGKNMVLYGFLLFLCFMLRA